MRFQILLLVLLAITKSFATTYYVDGENGSDGYSGISLDAPFRTISQAVLNMKAGDECVIRKGTYRETPTFSKSGTSSNRMIFESYRNEKVVLSATDPVTGWTQDGNRYRASIDGSLGQDLNQVFIDGIMALQAREPDFTGTQMPDIFNEGQQWYGNVATDGETVTSASIAQGTNAWKNGYIWARFGDAWSLNMAKIGGSGNGTISLTSADKDWPSSSNNGEVVLIGALSALDQPTEWHIDGQYIYLIPPAGKSINDTMVEVKRRMWCANVTGSYITFRNIDFFGGSIKMVGNYNEIENCTMKYITHFNYRYDNGESAGAEDGLNGIYLKGNYNRIVNSEISYSAGTGAVLEGDNNAIDNSLIHDFGYMGTWSSSVILDGSDSRMEHCTAFNSGRDVLHMGSMNNCKVRYNLFYGSGKLARDLGMLYTFGMDLEKTEISHNWIYGDPNKLTDFGYLGIYLDNGSRNIIAHHNVVWNANAINRPAINTNSPFANISIYNNTLIQTTTQDDPKLRHITYGTYCNCNCNGKHEGAESFGNFNEDCEDTLRNGFYHCLTSDDQNQNREQWPYWYQYLFDVDLPNPVEEENYVSIMNNLQYKDPNAYYDMGNLDGELVQANPDGALTTNSLMKSNGWEFAYVPDFRPIGDETDGAYIEGQTYWVPGYHFVPRRTVITPSTTDIMQILNLLLLD